MIYIYYHKECPDGFGAAFAAWLKFDNTATYIPFGHYDSVNISQFKKEDDVFFLDICPSREILTEIKKKVDFLTILDHHKTNEELVKEFNGVFDLNRSGALITHDYFLDLEEEERLFFEYISDRDLWSFKLDKSKEVNAYIMSKKYDFNEYLFAFSRFKYNFEELVDIGKSLVKQNEKHVEMI